MSDGATICGRCGGKLAPNTQFCGDCGALVEEAPVPSSSKGTLVGVSDQPAPGPTTLPLDVFMAQQAAAAASKTTAAEPKTGGGVPKKTLIGTADMLSAFTPPKPAEPDAAEPPSSSPAPAEPPSSSPAPAEPPSSSPAPAGEREGKPSHPLKSTMTGLSGEMPPVIPPESPTPPRPDEATRSTNAGVASPARGKMGRTMLGMPAAAGPMAARAGTLPPSGKLAEKKPAKTMFGMSGQAVTPPPPEPQERVSKATIISTSDAPPPGPDATAPLAGDRPMHARTAFGLPNMTAPAGSGSIPKSQAWSETITHGEAPATPLPPRFDDEERTDKLSGSLLSAARGDAAVTSRPPPPKSMTGPILLAVAVVAALGLGAYLWLGDTGAPPVKVRIENDNGVERMIFEVAGASPGAKLRFGGIEQPLTGGQAVFPLGAGSLQIGKNAVLFDVVEPNGEPQPGKLVLSLDYRVTVDTAPLNAGKGAVDVVVAALPGSRVWIGGEELKLDAQGRAQRRDEIEAGVLKDGKAVEHVVSYRVQPPSQEPQVGQIKTVVPIAALQIDRPGLEIVTAADAIEVAGTVETDATVTLDGEPLAVQEGRFLHRLPLPKPGKHTPELVARATGKAPRAIKLSIERVEDLAASARAFGADASLSYAKIAQNPEIYAGQKAAFEGRIYNVSVEGGRSVLQVLVRDCPAGVRCPLWVDYGAATELTVESWVRAVGTLAGAQKFRAENDSEQTVPRLSAVVLVPIKP